MKHVFTRIDPWNTNLRKPYVAYQELVREQRGNTYSPPNPNLPAELQHLQRVSTLPGILDTPQQKELKRPLDRDFGTRFLPNAADLAGELTERTSWLISQGTILDQSDRGNRKSTDLYSAKAQLPLELGEGFSDATATIGLSGEYETRRRNSAIQLGYLCVEFRGTNTRTGDSLYTYASIGSSLLELTQGIQQTSRTPHIQGRDLVDAFQLRDMLTFVENKAPDSLLPTQLYGRHIARTPVPTPAAVVL